MAKVNGKKLGIGMVMGVTTVLIAGGLFGIVQSSLSGDQAIMTAEATTMEGSAGSGVPVGAAIPVDDHESVACEFNDWIGKTASDAEASAKATGRPYRMLTPNSAMTMDFRADRINVELDGSGAEAKVTKVKCG